MTARLGRQIDAVAAMEDTALAELWRTLFDTPPPVSLSRALRVRAITGRLQEAALGGVSAACLRRLRQVATAQGDAPAPPTAAPLRPGMQLIRRWQGRNLCVTVREDGSFMMDGQRYGSLSQLARTVTGTPRSGPRFFGLVGDAADKGGR